MNMKRRAFTVAALAGASQSVFSQTVALKKWTVATGYAADSFHGQNLNQFLQDVQQGAKDHIIFNWQPDNKLYALGDIFQAVRDGKIEMGEVLLSGIAKTLASAGADAVPFVARSYADSERLWTLQRPILDQELNRLGVSVLYAVPWPAQILFTSIPIRSEADFHRLKLRTYNETTVRLAQLLGATPIDVATSEVSTALQAGRVDALLTSASTAVASQVWSQIKYCYEINAWFPKNAVLASTKAMQLLTPDIQKVIKDAALQAQSRGWELSQASGKQAIATLRSKGIKFDTLPAEILIKLKRLGEKFSVEWIKQSGATGSSIFTPYFFNQTNSSRL